MTAPRIVVIGSGAGGAACTFALAREGVDVLLLEAGPEYDPGRDYRLSDAHWELGRFPHKIPTAGRQRMAPMQPLDPARRDLRSWGATRGLMHDGTHRADWGYHHVVGLGGSTLHYTGEAHRLNPAAMRMRERFGVAADWPIAYEDLAPWYADAERIIGVAGPQHDPRFARASPPPLPAHPLSHAGTVLAAGARRLGLAWTPNARAALSRPYDGRPACNYCGNCQRGCSRLDKGSADLTFIAKARASGRCEIRTGWRVTRIETGERDRVVAVLCKDRHGAAHRVAAAAVVIACGAVETPRLLLNSASPQAPAGLGNESGQVGLHFMETVSWASAAVHPDPLGSHRGLPADGVCWDFNAPDAVPGLVGGCRFGNGTAEADLVGPIAYATRIVGGWGRDHQARMRGTFGRVLAVNSLGESLPHPRAFVDLDPQATDADGMPLARIHAWTGDEDVRRIGFMATTCREILDAAGAGERVEEYGTYDAFNATHVFGTCRMGDDPRDSVVDARLRSHRWRNLFVADASVFPSSGGGEGPSLTISALALRAGREIAGLARRDDL